MKTGKDFSAIVTFLVGIQPEKCVVCKFDDPKLFSETLIAKLSAQQMVFLCDKLSKKTGCSNFKFTPDNCSCVDAKTFIEALAEVFKETNPL